MQKQFEINIDKLAYGGAGIGRIDNKVHFIEGALPGEKVRFVKVLDKKRFAIGRATEILNASEDRIKPTCQYYEKCGGCQYQHLKYDKEVFFKGEQVKEALGRIGNLREFTFEGMTSSNLDYGYRSSITLHRSEKGYGFFAKDNKTIIPIDNCPIAKDAINKAINTLDPLKNKKDVILKCDKSQKVWIANYPGHRFFKDDFLGTELTFSPLAFSQTNQQVAAELVEKLCAWMQEEESQVLFDLYCGIGFFSVLLRGSFELIVGIDQSPIAIDCARTTKKALSIKNIKFYRGEADDSFSVCYEKLHKKTNTILIDPPRSGISKGLIDWLSALKHANSLYYISCDPAMLARDAKLLTQDKTWALDKVACFDMFPRTKHIETIALFKR